MMSIASEITRREFLKCAGAPVVAFGLPVELKAQTAPVAKPSGGPLPPNQLDSWLIVHKDGRVTVMTGKVELGTGVSTSLRQIVADELDCPFEKITWIPGSPSIAPDHCTAPWYRRGQRHGWEPLGPAMVMEVRGGLDAQGNVVAWDYHVWTPMHSSRPNGSAGSLLAGSLVGMSAGTPNQSGADRNANHTLYIQKQSGHG